MCFPKADLTIITPYHHSIHLQQVLLNAIGDDTQPILADATGQVISGEQAAFSFWNDNLANAKTIEGVGFQVQEAAFEIAEDVLLEDELAEAAQWLALFLL